MTKVRWVSSGFKGEGSSEKCPARVETEREGKDRLENWRVVGCFFLCWARVLEITWRIVWTIIFIPHIWYELWGSLDCPDC